MTEERCLKPSNAYRQVLAANSNYTLELVNLDQALHNDQDSPRHRSHCQSHNCRRLSSRSDADLPRQAQVVAEYWDMMAERSSLAGTTDLRMPGMLQNRFHNSLMSEAPLEGRPAVLEFLIPRRL